MVFHFLMSSSKTMRAVQTLSLSQSASMTVGGAAVGSGTTLSNPRRTHPVEFAQADNSYMYMATGLDPVVKWDGLAAAVVLAGVVAPTTAPTLAFSGTGGNITGNYQAYQRWLDADGNVSNLSLGSAVVNADEATLAEYTNVEAPPPTGVVRRQILRNAAGSFLVFYVDIDTTDLTSTSFTSSKDDDALRASEPVALFDPSLTLNLANFHGVPPDDKPLISFYQNRLWLYGSARYSVGMVQVTNGSTTVTGIGTEWTESMAGRLLYVARSERFYSIDSIDVENQTLTLTEGYQGATDRFGLYTIQPTPDRRHLLCYSEPGQPDSWRATQAIKVASSDDLDDEGTALISTQSFLYMAQRRHIYRLTFFEDPVTDGAVFLSARRGCINNRCWLNVDGFVYMMDDRGIYRFDGGDATEELSNPIQDLFYFDRPTGELRLNWSSSRFWHAHHDRNDATMRWFVGLSGQRYPRHALCFNYVNPQWWIEEYPWPVVASALLKSINPIPLAASKYHKVFAVGIGTLEDLHGSGDTFGSVESAGLSTLKVPIGVSLPSSLAGTPVGIVSGRGKGQLRIIASVSGQTLTLTHPWTLKPDSTSKFRLGAIPWQWRSQWMRWMPSETQQTRRIVATFLPADQDTTMDLRIYRDYSKTPRDNSLDWPINPSESSGITTAKGDPDAVVDLSLSHGMAYLTLSSLIEHGAWRKDVTSIEVRGVSGSQAVRLYQIDVEGAVPVRQSRGQ